MLLLTRVCVCVFFRLPPAVITAKIQREGEYWKVFKFLHFVTLPSNYTHSSIYIQSSAQWKTKTYAHVCTRTHTRTHKFHLTHKHLQKTITSKIWQTDLCLSYGERGFNAYVCVCIIIWVCLHLTYRSISVSFHLRIGRRSCSSSSPGRRQQIRVEDMHAGPAVYLSGGSSNCKAKLLPIRFYSQLNC